MKLEKIVVGTDLSETSLGVIEAALDIARQVGAEVVLVHATKGGGLELPFFEAPSELTNALDELDREQRGLLHDLRERYGGGGTTVSEYAVDASPARGLVETAEELDADLVVVGPRSTTGIRGLVLGSVARRVVRHCARSVLVAREAEAEVDLRKRILVPTDYSRGAEEALRVALAMVADGGVVEVLHCWRLPAEKMGGWTLTDKIPSKDAKSLRSRFEDAAREHGRELVERYPCERAEVRFSYVKMHPKEGILHQLEEERYSLVVMGSQGRRGLSRWLLGSVAETVVRHASCSVLVARERPGPAE